MSSLLTTYNSGVGDPPLAVATEPTTAVEYYNVLTGHWPNGLPQTRGSYGYQTGGDTTRFAFDGGDANGVPWQACTALPEFADIRTTYGVGPYRLAPGASMSFTLALTTLFGVDHDEGGCPDTDAIFAAADRIATGHESACGAGRSVGTEPPLTAAAAGLSVFPIPTSDAVTFRTADGSPVEEVTVTDLAGRVLLRRAFPAGGRVELAGAGLPAGVYPYRVRLADGRFVEGRVVVR